MSRTKLNTVVIVVAIIATFVYVGSAFKWLMPKTPKYSYYTSEQREEISAAIYNCEGGVFYLSLPRERLAEIQRAFDDNPHTKTVTISPNGISTKRSRNELAFRIDRASFEEIMKYFSADPNARSVSCVKDLSVKAFKDQSTVPDTEYRLHAFLTAPVTDALLTSIEGLYPYTQVDYCQIEQTLDIEGKRIISYSLYYDELMQAAEILSEDDAPYVVVVIDVYPFGKNAPSVNL